MYTREELIAICERAIAPESIWHDRDSEGATRQLGECWALLKAGCQFSISTDGDSCVTNDETIWVDITSKGFQHFEIGEMREDTFYIPTLKHLAATLSKGRDWYLKMNLKDLADTDQYEEPYRRHGARFVTMYKILRDLGAPEELAIGMVRDYHKLDWEDFFIKGRETNAKDILNQL